MSQATANTMAAPIPKCITAMMVLLTTGFSLLGCSGRDETSRPAPAMEPGADSDIQWPRLTSFYGRYVDFVMPVPNRARRLDSLQEVEVVLVSGCDITNDFITQLGRLPQLIVLDLRGSSVTDEQVALIRRHCPLLRVLALGGCAISDASSKVIGSFENLVVLDIGSTGLSDEAIRAFIKIETLALLAVGDRTTDDFMSLTANRKVRMVEEVNEFLLPRAPRW